MWELLRDPIWQGIGAAIGLIGVVSAIILGVVLFRLQRRRKELGYRVLSETRVVSVEAAVGERVQILYEGQPVSNVYLVVVELVNSGNQPIIPDDYHYPLHIGLGQGARVLAAEQVSSKPNGITAPVSITESLERVRVDPVLLNAGDSLGLKFLVTQYGGNLDVDARVVGVREIRTLGDEPVNWKVLVPPTLVVSLVLCLGFPAFWRLQDLLGAAWLGSALGVAGLTAYVVAVLLVFDRVPRHGSATRERLLDGIVMDMASLGQVSVTLKHTAKAKRRMPEQLTLDD
jgi:hypothetical protein